MSAGKVTDAELFAAGRRARTKGQCSSVVVATDEHSERNYHNCMDGREHDGKHGCGCGETWWAVSDGQVWTDGPLTDVVIAP